MNDLKPRGGYFYQENTPGEEKSSLVGLFSIVTGAAAVLRITPTEIKGVLPDDVDKNFIIRATKFLGLSL